MKINKRIVRTEPVDVNFSGATLLSVEEHEACRDIIPDAGSWWWLRSPGYNARNAACVDGSGYVYTHGYYVNDDGIGVRPALCFNLQSDKPLIKGDKVEVAGLTFTVISKDMMLCDTTVGKSAFREDYKAEDANIYKVSDIKRSIDKWYKDTISNAL